MMLKVADSIITTVRLINGYLVIIISDADVAIQ
jgi:hypothetical protein